MFRNAQQLGGVKPDDEWLQAEIARLKGKSIVPLQHGKTLHDWLDGKRKARKSCRVVGESRTGKTVACAAYIHMEEEDKEALQFLADAEERSLSQMAVLIVKRAIKQAQNEGKIPPKS
ncbi:hypothetical protein LC612_08780 [Nostoc sp. CHAB 5834]|nr:hypothetical protein [Nostoc sp. CHAB 5834]